MAGSDVRTWLPLDRWAEIIGLNPLHFNQLSHGTLLPNSVCGDVWFQHSWQHSDRVGREDIAMAIQEAERAIAAEIGYNLLPDWTVQERIPFPEPGIPGLFSLDGRNPRGLYQSIELPRGHVISGGVMAVVVIQAGAAVVRTDEDGDGWSETATVTVPTSVTDANEVKVYYPGHGGVSAFEVRPCSVAIFGGNAVITFKIWQLVAHANFEKINPDPVDAAQAGNFETTVDVFRVYNEPSTQVQFMWENDGSDCCGSCVACQFSTQAGCFHLRDARLGLAVPVPASWDAATSTFTEQEWTACRAPDQVRFWYYSGFRNMALARPNVQMDPFLEYAVAYYAASKLDRPVCGCSNVQQFIDHWRQDMMFTKEPDAQINVTAELMSNRFGTTQGAIYAYKRVHQNGVRIIK